MMEERTVGMTTHYRPLRQQRRIDNNNKTHLLNATISHMNRGPVEKEKRRLQWQQL